MAEQYRSLALTLNRLKQRDVVFVGSIVLVVVLSRVPFLMPGYGYDPDSWRMAIAARHIWMTGEYRFSRPPGYPLPEIVMGLVYPLGVWAVNGLTALMSGIAAAFTGLIVRQIDGARPILAALAFAATPLVYLNSTVAIDYLWTTAFVLGGLYALMRSGWIVGGILLGLAVGCRITSAVFILPALFIVLRHRNTGATARLLLAFGSTACLAWLPVVATYGTAFLAFYGSEYPGVIPLWKRMTLEIFERLGVYALLTLLAVVLVKRSWVTDRLTARRPKVLTYRPVWLLAIGLMVALFFAFPHEAEYLIPAIPFFWILMATSLRSSVVAVLAVVMLVSTFIQPCRSGVICDGALRWSIAERKDIVTTAESIVESASQLPVGSVLVASWWQPPVEMLADGRLDHISLTYLVDSTLLAEVNRDGLPVYYVDDAVSMNLHQHGINLEAIGQPLLKTGQ